MKQKALLVSLIVVLLSACGQTQELESPPAPKPPTTTKAPPTSTSTPVPTSTATSIPGVQVYPVTSLAEGIPWLPLDESKRPMSAFFGFNVTKPPFDNLLVRQAFAAAIDREAIAQAAIDYKFQNVSPATTLTPPSVLGRDLYGQVGIPFDPDKARDLMKQAGYSNAESFPPVTLLVYLRGEAAPGAWYQIAKMTAKMWQEYLGVTVIIDAAENPGQLFDRMNNNPTEIYHLGWGADYVDPDNFLNELFHSGQDLNYGNFSNEQFDRLVEQAAGLSNPSERQLLYIEAEKILVEDEAAVLPLFHSDFYAQP